MSSGFRRGKKYYYGSPTDLWDPGEEGDEARTSFRSAASDCDDDYYDDKGNSDDYVASLLRRQQDNNYYSDSNKGRFNPKPQKPPPPPPIPVVNHHQGYGRMNRSGELDDILEESGDEEHEEPSSGETSPRQSQGLLSSSSPASSNSPHGSFRMIPRGVSNRSSQESTESSNSSSGILKQQPRSNAVTQCYSHKSQDSGFSDSADSAEDKMTRLGSSVASSSTNEESPRNHHRNLSQEVDDLSLTNSEEEDHNVSHVQVDDGSSSNAVRSEVVHETRTNVYDHKQYHVSKVYFYSVSDILNNSNVSTNSIGAEAVQPEDELNHVSILDCETGRIRRGYGQDARTEIPVPAASPTPISPPANQLLLTPPQPPQRHSSLSSSNQNDSSFDSDSIPKLDPFACEMIPDDPGYPSEQSQFYFMEHKPLLPPRKPTSSATCTQISPSTSSPSISPALFSSSSSSSSSRIHAGTSSLGRVVPKHKALSVSPNTSMVSTHSSLQSRTLSGSLQSPPNPSSPILSTKSSSSLNHHPFPKTNGSLYESLSLGRPSSRGPKDAAKRRPLQHHHSMSDYHNQSEVKSFDSFDDPMKGARNSFKSFESMQRFSQIFDEIKCNR